MIASDETLRALLNSGDLSVEPSVKESDIRQVGLRLYLEGRLLVPVVSRSNGDGCVVDLRSPQKAQFRSHEMPSSGYTLAPGEMVLGSTSQRFRLSRTWVALLDGRSSLARVGLDVHSTATVVDNIYDDFRAVTLELRNNGPFDLTLSSGLPIGMLLVVQAAEPIDGRDSLQYAGQHGATPPLRSVVDSQSKGDYD